MTQDEAMKCLKKHKRWMTTKEVEEKSGISKGPASKNLYCLFKSHECERKLVRTNTKNRSWTYAWRIK